MFGLLTIMCPSIKGHIAPSYSLSQIPAYNSLFPALPYALYWAEICEEQKKSQVLPFLKEVKVQQKKWQVYK